VEIRELQQSEFDAAARLLMRAMLNNPIDVAVFGRDAARRQRVMIPFFRRELSGLSNRGLLRGAFDGDELLGVCCAARPGLCQPSFREKALMLATILLNGAPAAIGRLAGFVGEWARWNPTRPHWHLGPVGVDPQSQGRGVGSALVADFCRRVDDAGALAYLETDKRENVPFYEKHGFTVDRDGPVLGVPNWYMSREFRGPATEPSA
jgi:GNAT superfamily N-acetyltransferase